MSNQNVNAIHKLQIDGVDYVISATYLKDGDSKFDFSDVKTINGEAIIESGGGDIVTSPITFGETKNSAVLKGGNNVAGLKGWYYDSIYQKNTNTIYVYLKDKQKLLPVTKEAFKTTEQTPDTTLPDLFAILGNAIVSLVNHEIHDNMFEIIGGGKGVVHLRTVDQSQIPFNEIKPMVVNNLEDYSIYCVSKPDAGIFDIGQGSIAVGYNNRATNGGAIAFGQDNHSYGKFSFTEGKNNTASYASHAEGRNTQALGYISHAEGNASKAIGAVAHAEGENTEARGRASHSEGLNTIVNGDYSHCEGRETKVDSKYAHAEGYKTQATGNASHAEGYTTESSGQFSHAEGTSSSAVGVASHVEGVRTIANNKAEHASGIYNKSTISTDVSKATHFSIGIGTSDTNRKNAFEVKQNGDIYIKGLGGYTGNNHVESKDVATVINNIEHNFEKKHPVIGLVHNDIEKSKSTLDLISSLIKDSNTSPYIQGFVSNITSETAGAIVGSYTIISVGITNAKASAIIKVIGGSYAQGLNSYLVTVLFSVDVDGNYSDLEVITKEEFNSSNMLERISKLEDIINNQNYFTVEE